MSNQETPLLPEFKESVELRLELKYRKISSRFFKGATVCEPVQREALQVYVKITNISSKICKGIRITNSVFKFQSHGIDAQIYNEVQVPLLNPKQSIELKLDNITFNLDGSCWFSCDIIPESEEQEILSFQYDSNHDADSSFKDMNKWGSTVYVKGKAASLQAKTNSYILVLTLVTVLEAVFGLKNILQWTAQLLASLFSVLTEFFVFLASIT
jgi:hypothetical protein